MSSNHFCLSARDLQVDDASDCRQRKKEYFTSNLFDWSDNDGLELTDCVV